MCGPDEPDIYIQSTGSQGIWDRRSFLIRKPPSLHIQVRGPVALNSLLPIMNVSGVRWTDKHAHLKMHSNFSSWSPVCVKIIRFRFCRPDVGAVGGFMSVLLDFLRNELCQCCWAGLYYRCFMNLLFTTLCPHQTDAEREGEQCCHLMVTVCMWSVSLCECVEEKVMSVFMKKHRHHRREDYLSCSQHRHQGGYVAIVVCLSRV